MGSIIGCLDDVNHQPEEIEETVTDKVKRVDRNEKKRKIDIAVSVKMGIEEIFDMDSQTVLLLQCLAFLPSKEILINLVEKMWGSVSALQTLFYFIIYDEKKKTISMHDMFSELIREFTHTLDEQQGPSDSQLFPERIVLSKIVPLLEIKDFAYFIGKDAKKEITIYQYAVQEEQRKSHPDPKLLSTYYEKLGSSCIKLSYFEKAYEALQESLKYSDTTSLEKAHLYNSIGKSLHKLRRNKEAHEYHQEARKLLDFKCNDHRSEISRSQRRIGSTLRDLTNQEAQSLSFEDQIKAKEQGLEFHRKALEIDRSIYTENSERVSKCYQQIGLSQLFLGREYEKTDSKRAAKTYLDAFDAFKTVLVICNFLHNQQDHPQTAHAYHLMAAGHYNYAKTQNSVSDLITARRYLEKALAMRRRMFGNIQYDLAVNYHELGVVNYQIAIHEKSEGDRQELLKNILSQHTKALSIFQKIYSSSDKIFSSVYKHIGLTYEQLGHYQKALNAHKSCLINLLQIDQIGLEEITRHIPELKSCLTNPKIPNWCKQEVTKELMEQSRNRDSEVLGVLKQELKVSNDSSRSS